MTEQPAISTCSENKPGKRPSHRPFRAFHRAVSNTTVVALSGIFALAVIVRMLPVAVFPSVAYPDEIFQTLEQAHRLVFGYGSVPWEFQYGARSWLLPGFLAPFMQIGAWIGGGDPVYYLAVVHLALAAVSAGACVCAYLWGRRFYGSWGGIIAAALPALWPDNVYFGARPLYECVAAPLLVIGIYLAAPGYRVKSRRRLAASGALLGLAVAIRLQVAPAVVVVLLWAALNAPRLRLPPIICGMATVMLAAGVLDWATWGYPFASMWRNFDYNEIYGVSEFFGSEPWYFYLSKEFYYWNVFAIVLPLVALWSVRRVPVVLFAAVAVLVAHGLVAHKEIRFIYPAVLLLSIAAGIGMADLASKVAAVWNVRMATCALFFIAPTAISAALVASTPRYQPLWQRMEWVIDADHFTSGLQSVCGVGAWMAYAGQTFLHRDVPVYFTIHEGDVEKYEPAFNTLITTIDDPPRPSDFRVIACFGEVCVSQRKGRCEDMPSPSMPVPPPLGLINGVRE